MLSDANGLLMWSAPTVSQRHGVLNAVRLLCLSQPFKMDSSPPYPSKAHLEQRKKVQDGNNL